MCFIKYSSVHLVVCPLNQGRNGSGGNDPDSKSETITIYFILSGEIMENISVIKVVSIYSEMKWYHFTVH